MRQGSGGYANDLSATPAPVHASEPVYPGEALRAKGAPTGEKERVNPNRFSQVCTDDAKRVRRGYGKFDQAQQQSI
jgi:hypothetical protein